MNCQNCGAPLSPLEGRDYLYCAYCTSFYFPHPSEDGVRVLGTDTGWRCPACGGDLVTSAAAGAQTLSCERCRGLLVPQGSFAVVVRELRSRARTPAKAVRPLNRAELERKLYCPRCQRKMDTHPYAGPGNIVIDLCTRCTLIWLDSGELAQIRDAPGRDRGESAEERRLGSFLKREDKNRR